MSKIKTRDVLFPEFQISKLLEQFKAPPCQPPKGRDVMERFFDVLYSQSTNNRDGRKAAWKVALELDELWKLGDARIPRKTPKTIQSTILHWREQLRALCKKDQQN